MVLDALVASGQADRTVVIFTSDHGEMAGSHGLRQKGNLVYDENFRVPFVVRHPDLAGGATVDALASAVVLACCIGFGESGRAADLPGRSEFVSKHMGTTFRVVLYAPDQPTAEKAARAGS